MKQEIETLTAKKKKFCYEYCIDLNATQAAIRAGYSKRTARSIGCENLTKPDIQKKIRSMQENLSETAGITALRVLLEHKKIAFVNTSDIYVTWYKRREFEALPEEIKACISEIETKIRTEWEFNSDTKKKEPLRVEYIKIKLYDKQKALEGITRMLGCDAPVKTEITGRDGKALFAKMTDEDLQDILDEIRNKSCKQE